MEVLIPLLFIGFVCGCIGLWFGGLRNRETAGFWLGFFLGPFGWLLTLLLPAETSGQAPPSEIARTIPEQRGIGRCPTCGGGLVGLYPKCPHCASAVFWAGQVPMGTAQEAADEQKRQERLAAERREREKQWAAQRQRQHEEELERQREAQCRWEERKRKALRWGEEQSRVTLVALVSVARWLLRRGDKVLRGLTRHRRDVRVRRVLVPARWWGRKADRALREWSNRLAALNEAGMRRCLGLVSAILLILVLLVGALVISGAVGKQQEARREQEKQELAQRRRYERVANRETILAVLGFRRSDFGSDFDWDKGIAEGTEAIQLDSRNAIAYRCRGFARCVRAEWEPAMTDLTEAISLDPKDARVYHLRGFVLCVRGEWESAIADLTEAIRLAPGDTRAYAFRSIAHSHTREVERANDDRAHAETHGLTRDEFARVAELLE
jgi:tetratricopeptide (TPR) repeat protein